MTGKRRRRSRLERKFVVRRIILLLIPVALIAVIVLFINRAPAEEQKGDVPAAPVGEAETGPEDAAAPTEPETVAAPALAAPWNLLLVNSQNPIPDGFEEDLELENLVGEFQVDRRIIESYTRMSNQAKEDGVDLMVCSAYRSIERQTELFEGRKDDYLADGMSEEEAIAATLQYTTHPGTSEHHTGLSVDIVTPEYQNLDEGYAETAAAKWLLENAAEYGFILRYPKGKETTTQVDFEPWHYRYVGEEAAGVIMAEGMCLEDYIYGELRQPENGSAGDAPEDEPGTDANDEPADEPEGE